MIWRGKKLKKKKSLQMSIILKKRGNKEQYKHNAKVMANIKKTNEEMEEGCTQEARQKLSEGYEFIKPRQKPIELAYSSAAG